MVRPRVTPPKPKPPGPPRGAKKTILLRSMRWVVENEDALSDNNAWKRRCREWLKEEGIGAFMTKLLNLEREAVAAAAMVAAAKKQGEEESPQGEEKLFGMIDDLLKKPEVGDGGVPGGTD